MSDTKKIAIIGAGFGGMSAAWDLARAGHRVTLFEAASHVGGLAAGFKSPGWDWSVEHFYHHWFQSDSNLLGLAAELGVRDKVFYPRPFTVILHKGKWYPFDDMFSTIPLFLLRHYPIQHTVRFGLVGLYLKLTQNWQALEKTTVDAWMRKWAGDYVYETMWEPMMIGKFGPFYKNVNMAWLWARLKARTTRLGTYEGGFQQFADDFAEKLKSIGVEFRLSTPIEKISPAPNNQVIIQPVTQEAETYDKALVTTSPGLLARLTPSLPTEYLSGLQSLKHMGAVVLVFSLKHQLSKDGYYWFNVPSDAGHPFLALVEHTNFVSPDHFGGEHIVYCGDYLPVDHENFTLTKEELVERFLPSLKDFNQAFTPGWVNQTWLFRTPYAQPVPLVNHSQNIPEIQTPIPGLYFASMSQVYPWDRGTNFAVEIGRRAAGLMMVTD